jgi:hypothetical protein
MHRRAPMGLSLLVAIVAGLACAAEPRLPTHAQAGRAVLFDGKTLAGWNGDPAHWSVQDGAITGTAERLKGSFLLSEQEYDDFRLTMYSRMKQSNNHSGLCMWGPRPPTGTWFPFRCILVIPPTGGMWDYNQGKGGIKGQKLASPAIPKNRWHRVEILARRSTGEIRAAFDGIEVIRYKDPDPARLVRGPIGLQLHGGRQPQAVQYKDIVIEPNPKHDRLLTALPARSGVAFQDQWEPHPPTGPQAHSDVRR